jgi:hypothetical protein
MDYGMFDVLDPRMQARLRNQRQVWWNNERYNPGTDPSILPPAVAQRFRESHNERMTREMWKQLFDAAAGGGGNMGRVDGTIPQYTNPGRGMLPWPVTGPRS